MGTTSAPPRAERVLGPALERHYQYLLWLMPTLEKLPRSQKFLLGDRLQTQALQVLDARRCEFAVRSPDDRCQACPRCSHGLTSPKPLCNHTARHRPKAATLATRHAR